MGFLLGHSAWQIDQFSTCWPMNGLFVHWSRGWGVSSFSERLVSCIIHVLCFSSHLFAQRAAWPSHPDCGEVFWSRRGAQRGCLHVWATERKGTTPSVVMGSINNISNSGGRKWKHKYVSTFCTTTVTGIVDGAHYMYCKYTCTGTLKSWLSTFKIIFLWISDDRHP